MRWLSIAILVMVVFAFSPAKSAQADDFSFSIGFHDELSPYGSWVNFSSYGNVWRPHGYSGWRPYMDGYWGYTDYGPTWYGNEPYAPYVYHYGNWIYTARYGWVWVPGYDWHAGRVNWSYGGGYIGWRPMFPSNYYYPGNDYNFWVVIDSDRFGYRSYRPYALGSTYVRDLFARRVFRQRYNTFRRAELERIVRRPVRVLNVRERVARIGDRRARMLVTDDDEVRIRKHVTQIRGRGDNRRVVERDTVMKRKFDDIRTKSEARRTDSRRKADFDRSRTVRKSDSIRNSKEKVEKSRTPRGRELERKSTSRSTKSTITRRPDRDDNRRSSNERLSNRQSDRDRVSKARLSSRDSARERVSKARVSSRQLDRDRVSKSRLSSRSSSRVERDSVRKNEVRSSKGREVSKAQRPATKKESVRKQKPRDRRN